MCDLLVSLLCHFYIQTVSMRHCLCSPIINCITLTPFSIIHIHYSLSILHLIVVVVVVVEVRLISSVACIGGCLYCDWYLLVSSVACIGGGLQYISMYTSLRHPSHICIWYFQRMGRWTEYGSRYHISIHQVQYLVKKWFRNLPEGLV